MPNSNAAGLAIMGLCASACACLPAQAQTYPAKPIRIICPAAPGGISDLLSRIAAQRLTPLYNQQVIVENRTGSGGHVAAYGLVVNFDTYQNATNDPRSIEVFADANSVGNFLAANLPGGNFTYDRTFRTVTLHWDAVKGLDLTYDGIAIFTGLPTPGFIPTVGCNFAINAATGIFTGGCDPRRDGYCVPA